MSKSEDVQTLFRRFGGNASTYQEVVSRDQVAQAESKWPILGLINPTANQEAPSVRRSSVAPSSRQNQLQPVLSPVGGLAQPQPASPVDTTLNRPVAAASPAGMFAGLAPSRSAQPAVATKPSLQAQSAANARAQSDHESRVASPAVGSVLVGPGAAQGGLFNRFKAVVRPVAVKLSSSAVPAAPVNGTDPTAVSPMGTGFTPSSPPISTDSPVGGGMFASLVPAPSPDISGALGHAPIRGVPPTRMESVESKVVPGSELQALFGRMLPPPPAPAPVTKKQPKSSKKAVKW